MFALPALSLLLVAAAATPGEIDLTHAIVVTPAQTTRQEQKAVQVLVEEVEKRSGVRLGIVHTWPGGEAPAIAIAPESAAHALIPQGHGAPPAKADAYTLQALNDHGVAIVGHDARGELFGVGHLLRMLHIEHGRVTLPRALDIATAPATPLRGHQLGYRPKTNSYDAWTPEMWEQYIRDLAVFGTNAIELIPPRSDDAPSSPHFPLPQIEMMKRMSQICDDYGLDVWVWYPALDKDYGDPATVDFALKEWGEVFAQLPRIDAIFVPGGDPGHTPPNHMMALLEKQTENLHRTHPKATMWMSPQGFTKEWMDEFLDYMKTTQPAWMKGVVFGPQNRLTLKELRERLPRQYDIRHYPDITHSILCQFPVPDWDYAYVLTEHRECINPRPKQFEHIYKLFSEGTVGFLTYSEGCNDDVNKIVWSGLGWRPDMPVDAILRQYARYFIGAKQADAFAKGLLALEQNWSGPLLANSGVMTTLAQFQEMERDATPQMKLNWRFQQALYRAYYDAYVYRRLQYETELEQEAMDALRAAARTGADAAAAHAEAALARAASEPVAQDLRARVFELGEALYQSIRMQLSVPRYKAISVDRGANLDLIDTPLNDRAWLTARLAEVRAANGEAKKRELIDAVVNWTNPGPGGYYDALGDPTRNPHLVRSAGYIEPEYKAEPLLGRDYEPLFKNTWCRYAETRYESPLVMQYNDLDHHAQYALRVVYGIEIAERKVRLEANGAEIHGFIEKPIPPKPLEFDIPQELTKDGKLRLQWAQEPCRGGGRGCQVAEVWLLKRK